MTIDTTSRRSKVGVAWLGFFLALSGCGGGGDNSADTDCVSACTARGSAETDQVCGTDGKTYGRCDYLCGATPDDVTVEPGACGQDGKPQMDLPPEDDKTICDYIKIGDGDYVAVECPDGEVDEDPSQPDPAAPEDIFTALGPSGDEAAQQTSAPPPDPKNGVDHSSRWSQAKRQNTIDCSAFAATAALESGLFLATGQKWTLSETHLWAKYYVPNQFKAIDAVEKTGGIATDADAVKAGWAYDGARSYSWLDKGPVKQQDKDILAALDMKQKFGVENKVRIWWKDLGKDSCSDIGTPKGNERSEVACGSASAYVKKLQEVIGSGKDVLLGLTIAPGSWDTKTLKSNGVIPDYVPAPIIKNTPPKADVNPNSGHAVLLVGYAEIDGKNYFKLRNSWGAAWGAGGYAFISFDTLPKVNGVSYVTTVKTTAPAPDCPKDTVPVSFDGTCRKLCPGGTTANDKDECPDQNGCFPGQVKIWSGECVEQCKPDAMPVAYSGVSSAPDLTRQCEAGRCKYDNIPGGVWNCNAGPGFACYRYCTAPNCALIQKKSGDGLSDIIGCERLE